MAVAQLIGQQAVPKGLRHGLAVTALQGGVPINLVKRWLGHARLSTKEIYANVIGPEDQAIASLLWKTFQLQRPGRRISNRPPHVETRHIMVSSEHRTSTRIRQDL